MDENYLDSYVKDALGGQPSGDNINDLSSYVQQALTAKPVAPVNGGSRLSDLAVAAAKGVVGLGEGVVGLADIPTFGRAGRFLEDTVGYRPEDTQKYLSDQYSPQYKQDLEALRQSDGLLSKIATGVTHPALIGNTVVESLPSMLGGQAMARGLMGAIPSLSRLAAGAAGEGLVTAGSQTEQARQDSPTGALTPGQTGLAALSGVGTGLIAGGMGKIANRYGLADVQQALLGGERKASNLGPLARAAGSGASEFTQEMLQSGQEQALSNLAMDRPWQQGMDEAMALGGLAGLATGAAFGALPQGETQTDTTDQAGSEIPPTAGQEQDAPTAQDIPPTAPPPAPQGDGILSKAVTKAGLTPTLMPSEPSPAQMQAERQRLNIAPLTEDEEQNAWGYGNDARNQVLDLLKQANQAQQQPVAGATERQQPSSLAGLARLAETPPQTQQPDYVQNTGSPTGITARNPESRPTTPGASDILPPQAQFGDTQPGSGSAVPGDSGFPIDSRPVVNPVASNPFAPGENVSQAEAPVKPSRTDLEIKRINSDFLAAIKDKGFLAETGALSGQTQPKTRDTLARMKLDDRAKMADRYRAYLARQEPQPDMQANPEQPQEFERAANQPEDYPFQPRFQRRINRTLEHIKEAQARGDKEAEEDYRASLTDINDSLSGFTKGKPVRNETVTDVQKYIEKTNQQAHYVESDLVNLSGLNSHYGDNHEIVDPIVRRFTDIFAEEMQNAGKQAIFNRQGGDEFNGIVIGGTDESIAAAKERVRQRSLALAKELGLDGIPHSKKGKEHLKGTGFHLGSSPIINGLTLDEIYATSARELHLNKIGSEKNVNKEPGSLAENTRNVAGRTGEATETGANASPSQDKALAEREKERVITPAKQEPIAFDSDAFTPSELQEIDTKAKAVTPEKLRQWARGRFGSDRMADFDAMVGAEGETQGDVQPPESAPAQAITIDQINIGDTVSSSGDGTIRPYQGKVIKKGKATIDLETTDASGKVTQQRGIPVSRLVGNVDVSPAVSQDAKGETQSADNKPPAIPQPARNEALLSGAVDNKTPVDSHIEGDGIERITPTVVDKAIDKAKTKLHRSKKEMRDWLIGEIDKAIKDAPVADVGKLKQEAEKAQLAKLRLTWPRLSEKELLSKLGRVNLPDSVIEKYGQVTFDVPGDGKFRVLNVKSHLEDFKSKVKASPGFSSASDRNTNPKITKDVPTRGVKAILDEAIDDGDYENAVMLSEQYDMPLKFSYEKGNAIIYSHVEAVDDSRPMFVGKNPKNKDWVLVDEDIGGVVEWGNNKQQAILKGKAALEPLKARGADIFAKTQAEREKLLGGKVQEKLLEMFKKEHGIEAEQEAATPDAQATAAPQDPTPEKPDSDNKPELLDSVGGDKSDTPKPDASRKENIQDLGDKIGGARKDLASRGYVMTGGKKSQDDRPTWAKRFDITFIENSSKPDEVGKWLVSDNKIKNRFGHSKPIKFFDTEKEAKNALPLIAVSLKHRVYSSSDGKYEIWRDVNERKRIKVVRQAFDSREQAMVYLAKHAKDILETNTTFGEADLPTPENIDRIGKARRTGDVDGKAFMDTLGFRAVEFGNWNNQSERQQLMNAAYDGLLDMAEILNIPPKAIGLNGELALAFGARGHGLTSAKAHYERSYAVINLTKESGAGSLAHEWFHSLDHYFGRQDGKANSEWQKHADGTKTFKTKGPEDYASHGFNVYKSGVRDDLRKTYENIINTLFFKAETFVEDTQKADKFVGRARQSLAEKLDSLRNDLSAQKDPKYYKRNNKPASAEQLVEFDTIAKDMLDGNQLKTAFVMMPDDKSIRGRIPGRVTNDALERISKIYKAVRGRSGFDSTNYNGVLDSLKRAMALYGERLDMLDSAQSGEKKSKQVPTSFAMNAKELDQGRGSNYWTTPHEMAARAFQAYVEDKLADIGGKSPFLTYGPENVGIFTPWGVNYPFPQGDERKAINAAFDKFVTELKTKQTAAGAALYSKASANASGNTPKDIQAMLPKWAQKLVDKGVVKVVQSHGRERVEGFYKNGMVTLVADNLTQETLPSVLKHEVLHYALATDTKTKAAFDGFKAEADKRMKLAARGLASKAENAAYQRMVAAETPVSDRLEEFLAYQVTAFEANPKSVTAAISQAIQRFIGALKVALMRMGFTNVGKIDGATLSALARFGASGKQVEDSNSPKFSIAQPVLQDKLSGAIDEHTQRLKDSVLNSSSSFNWINKTLSSQSFKAWKDKDYKKVYDESIAFEEDVAKFANKHADLAANLLPGLDTFKAAAKEVKDGFKRRADAKAIGDVIFDATLNKKHLSRSELQKKGLSDAQIGMYHEFFNSVNASLEDLALSEMARMAKADNKPIVTRLRANQTLMDVAKQYGEPRYIDIARKIAKLKNEAYAPLMRFGKYTVKVMKPGLPMTPEEAGFKRTSDGNYIDPETGETFDEGEAVFRANESNNPDVLEFFGMFESQAEANAMARSFTDSNPEFTVSTGVLSEKEWEMFRDVTPETLEVVGKLLGHNQDEAFQEYLKMAISNRSAMKRLIHRKGVKGYSIDTQRVLATFLTSNARMISKNYHLGNMLDAVAAIPKEKGDVKDEAIGLYQFVQNPNSAGASIRNILANWYLLGSVSAAAVNLTQNATTTLPGLALLNRREGLKVSAVDIAKIHGKAFVGAWNPDKLSGDLKNALRQAEYEGVVKPQDLFQLYGESMRTGLFTNVAPFLRPVARLWGHMFAMAETFNRRVAFIAAYNMAKGSPYAKYRVAEQFVMDTQFQYSKSNRSNAARGLIGSTVFTFKSFLINYIEFLRKFTPETHMGDTLARVLFDETLTKQQRLVLGKKLLPDAEIGLALATLILLSGVGGLPGADDLDDVIDTVGQMAGYNTNAKGWKEKHINALLLHGVSAAMPFDISSRVSAGNLIPGTGIFKRSETNKARDIAEFVGPAGSFFSSLSDAVDVIGARDSMTGKGSALLHAATPLAISNLIKAVDMIKNDAYRDYMGKKVTDTDTLDALFKGIGFQPSKVAEVRRPQLAFKQLRDLTVKTESEIAGLYAAGIYEKDSDKVKEARALLRKWNRRNPDTPIKLSARQIMNRVKAMRMTSGERLSKYSPKELRNLAASSF